MFKRKADKGHKEHKGNDFDPFGLGFNPEDLKFDESALEKELADIIGDEEAGEDQPAIPKHSQPRVPKRPTPSDDEAELLRQLEESLALEDDNPDRGASTDVASSPEANALENNEGSSESLNRIDESFKPSTHPSPSPPTSNHETQSKQEPVHHPQRKTGQEVLLDYVTGVSPKPTESGTADVVKKLRARLKEYRAAVALAHERGDKRREIELMVVVNALVESIPQIESGAEEFDPETMPPPPEDFSLPPDVLAELTAGAASAASPQQPPSPQRMDPAVAAITKMASSTVVSKDSLNARMQLLRAMIQGADASTKRMYERALEAYGKALRAYEAGVRYDYGGLAALPGCPTFSSVAPRPAGAAGASASSAANAAMQLSSSQARTLELLQKRQAELRAAAARAKARGDMNSAREYLRSSLGMNNMIRSVQAGLPIDLKQLPPAPHGHAQAASGSAGAAIGSPHVPILSGKKCEAPVDFVAAIEAADKDPSVVCDKLIEQLTAQAEEADTLSKDHREACLSDLADKFFDLADVSRKWAALTTAYKKRSRVPHYSFETANLSRLNMNPDLGDTVLEVTVVRGISLPLPPGISSPSGLDTYVTLELPFPSSESPQKHSTEWARHTNEPTNYGGYQASARFEVNRKSRTYERLLQGSRTLKATVYYNRGLLKRPGVLGTVNAKLNELTANASHTACYDLMEGRKAVGGRLELRFRHREPIHGSKFCTYEKPWLCISTSNTTTKETKQKL